MMNRFLYSFLLYLALPLVPLKLLWRGTKQPAYRQHWGERFGYYQVKITKPIIWLHCVSVGETRAAEPLIKAYKRVIRNIKFCSRMARLLAAMQVKRCLAI